MTRHREWFSTYEPFKPTRSIKYGNGTYRQALGKGTINVTFIVNGKEIDIELEDAWHIPEMDENLISWGAAAGKGLCLTSQGTDMTISDAEGVVAVGKKVGVNLWTLNIKVRVSANICKSSRTLEDWHAAIGHSGIEQIKDMSENDVVTGLEIAEQSAPERCGECQAGKGHHASHPSSSRQRATDILERVHTDLVGPKENKG